MYFDYLMPASEDIGTRTTMLEVDTSFYRLLPECNQRFSRKPALPDRLKTKSAAESFQRIHTYSRLGEPAIL